MIIQKSKIQIKFKKLKKIISSKLKKMADSSLKVETITPGDGKVLFFLLIPHRPSLKKETK